MTQRGGGGSDGREAAARPDQTSRAEGERRIVQRVGERASARVSQIQRNLTQNGLPAVNNHPSSPPPLPPPFFFAEWRDETEIRCLLSFTSAVHEAAVLRVGAIERI